MLLHNGSQNVLLRSKGEQGQCIPYESSIVGQPCALFQSSLANVPLFPSLSTLRAGVNDQMTCGLVKFDDDGSYFMYEWLGVCEQGRYTPSMHWLV